MVGDGVEPRLWVMLRDDGEQGMLNLPIFEDGVEKTDPSTQAERHRFRDVDPLHGQHVPTQRGRGVLLATEGRVSGHGSRMP